MAKVPALYFQHRHTIGHFNQSQNKKQNALTQQQIRQLARHPGLHSGNIQKQYNAQVLIQAIAMLSSVCNIDRTADVIENKDKMGINQYEVGHARKTISSINLVQNMAVGSTNRALQTQHPSLFSSTSMTTKITPTSYGLSTFLDPMTTMWHDVNRVLSKYDPLKFPSAEAKEAELQVKELPLSPQHIRHKRGVLTETEQANRDIMHYLQEHSNLEHLSLQKEILVSAVAEYLFYGDLSNLEKELRIIARYVLAAQKLYGGKQEEQLSVSQAKTALGHWMFDNILGMSLEEHIVRHMVTDKNHPYLLVNSFYSLYSLKTLDKIPMKYRTAFFRMWFSILTQKIPLLKHKDKEVLEFRLNHYDFAALYAGAGFLNDMNTRYTLKEAIQVGEKMWDIAISEGITEDKIKYFQIPALFFMAKWDPDRITQETTIQDVNLIALNEYIQYRRSVEVFHKDITQKYDTYQSAVKAWMSKGTLANNIINSYSIQQLHKLAPVPERLQYPLTEDEYRSRVKQLYLDDVRTLGSESLSEKYRKLTSNVADSYGELDKYLIYFALLHLPEKESHFVFSPDALLHPVTFSMKNYKLGQYVMGMDNIVSVKLDKTDLFSVKIGKEERIYALKVNQDIQEGYRLVRVDRNIWRYIEADLLDYKGFGSNYKILRDRVITRKDEFSFTIRTEMNEIICKGGEEITLIDFLSTKHRDQFYNALYQSGHDQSDKEKVWGIVKHIIPFYNCVEGIINHDSNQAVPSCLLDFFVFIPVFGVSGRLSQRFGATIIRGLHKGMAQSGLTFSKNSLFNVAKTVLSEVNLPTTSELMLLGKTTLRSLDPGIELLTKVSEKFSDKVMFHLFSDIKTADLAHSIQSLRLIETLSLGSSLPTKTAFLPYSNIQVPVKKVGNMGMDDIYAQMNPETGEVFGYYYTINEKNRLVKQESSENIQPIKNIDMGTELKYSTSLHVSNGLEKLILPEMYERNIDFEQLSSPDNYGLRWNAQQETFLKIKDGYVKIRKINKNRFLLSSKVNTHKVILLRFKHNQFFVENARERLKNILDVGLSGRKRKYPIDVLKEVDGFNTQSAENLLSEYQFPDKGFYDAYSFALQIEQTGEIPVWAERFKKIKLNEQYRSEISETVNRVNPNLPKHTIAVHLGDEIGRGSDGEIFLDADDTRFVIKRILGRSRAVSEKKVLDETQNFVRYYGPDSAVHFRDTKGNCYIRMYRIPGMRLGVFPENSLPLDAIERFVDMLEKMNKVGIFHGDLHAENVFWDPESQIFYPLDISNRKERYFKSSPHGKSDLNRLDETAWKEIIKEIKLRMRKSTIE